MIVANTGKVTELIEHRGTLQDAHEKALLYVGKDRCRIKRMVKTEVGGVLAGMLGWLGIMRGKQISRTTPWLHYKPVPQISTHNRVR